MRLSRQLNSKRITVLRKNEVRISSYYKISFCNWLTDIHYRRKTATMRLQAIG